MGWNLFNRGAGQTILRLEHEHWYIAPEASTSSLDSAEKKPFIVKVGRAGGIA